MPQRKAAFGRRAAGFLNERCEVVNLASNPAGAAFAP